MRNSVKLIILTVILVLVAIFTVSCGDSDENFTSITTPNLEYKDGAYRVTVSSDVKSLDLTSLFSVSENAKFFISESGNFENSINFEVTLNDGENNYFVKVTDGNYESVYQFVIYKKKTFKVTFNTNGGSDIAEVYCEEGQYLEAPISLKPGYTLNWDYDFKTPVNSDVTINANWQANKYSIHIDGTDTYVDVIYGEKPELTAPAKNGYKFVEWQYNGSKFDATQSYSIADDIKIVPIYELQKYTINYVTIGGVNNNPSTYTVEDEIVFSDLLWEITSGDTVIHTFDGWYSDANYTNKIGKIEKGTVGSVVVYAKWTVTDIPEEKIETTITFSAPNYDCDNTTQTVVVGEEYNLPQLELNGYIFSGWKTEDGSVVVQANGIWSIARDNVTLIPMWTKQAYTITYVLNYGDNNAANPETYYITDSFTLLAPEKNFSNFVGWYLDENFENSITEIVEGTYGDLVIYAKWEEVLVTVNYDTNGGQISQNSQALVLGGKYILLEPVKLGYEFDGWYNGDDLVNFSGTWTINEPVTLVAKWTVETYTITYELNGGTADGLVESYTVENDSFTLPIPVSGARKFIGWSVNDGPITYNMIVLKGSVGDRTYVAHWFDLESEGVVYSINGDVATVIGYKGVVGKTINIPSEYNGYRVVAIGDNAFSGYGTLLEGTNTGSGFATLYIPNTITRIGTNAFKDCDDLKVQLANNPKEDAINEWVNNVMVETGNDHVIDVIMGKRPAIGWKIYYNPEN